MITPRRHLSVPLRLVWAATTLITVWCLGCTAFDPLLALLVGAKGPVMACASDGAMDATQGASADTGTFAASDSALVAAPAVTGHSYVCGCQSCHAAHAAASVRATTPQPTPQAQGFEAVALASVERAPLLPPPEHIA